MTSRIIEEDLFVKYNIVDHRLPEGQRIHKFLEARAKALGGRYIDFEKTPVTFVISDSDQPNAFYARAPNPNPRSDEGPVRDEYSTVRYTKNTLDTHVICVTRGLIELVDNLDQLDFVIGHELTHMIMRGHGIEQNSKGEEEISDLHSVDLMYDAGSDPKQALIISEKLDEYRNEHLAKIEAKYRKRYRYGDDKEREMSDIRWSEIFDVHMTHENRKTTIEAALTRLSHLIDDMEPSDVDKSVFDAEYEDPVDAFLKAHGYEDQKPLGKLKLLVDCVEHLAEPAMPPEEYYQAKLDALPEEDPFSFSIRDVREERKNIQEHIDNGYPRYYHGPVIDKKYQQKLANLAEGVINRVRDENEDRPHKRREDLNTEHLRIYTQNKAYDYLDEHGYPKKYDHNHFGSVGVLYTYFDHLFKAHSPDRSGYNRNPIPAPKKAPRLETDIRAAKQTIRTATTFDEFANARDRLKDIEKIQADLTSIIYLHRIDKLDNLSSMTYHRHDPYDRDYIFEIKEGQDVPWNNLVAIANADEKHKSDIIAFLKENDIEDFRLTHGLPYVRKGRHSCYAVGEDGKFSDRRIQEHELDFAVHRDTVLEAYDYVRTYFDQEAGFIDQTCAAALGIEDADFVTPVTSSEEAGNKQDRSVAYKKIDDFFSMFNALPEDTPDEEKDEYRRSQETVTSLIPDRYRREHLMPGSKIVKDNYHGERITSDFTHDLFQYENPIFQEHFGADFKADLVARKRAQHQKMFDTAFALLERSIDMWLDAKPKLEALQEEYQALNKKKWSSRIEDERDAVNVEMKALNKRLELQKQKEDETGTTIHRIMNSAISPHDHWRLHRLTIDQRKVLAEFAIRDEKGAMVPNFYVEGYERFCDFMGVMDAQVDRVIAGDFELTDHMKTVAGNYGFRHTNNPTEFNAFVADEKKNYKGMRERKYAWYMHVFDVMQYLEGSSDINVQNLAKALGKIEQNTSTSSGADTKEIVHARYTTYVKFLNDSNVLELVGRAIVNDRNYEDLSCDEALATAESLITIRRKASEVVTAPAKKRDKKEEDREISLSDDWDEHDYDYDEERRAKKLEAKAEHLQFFNGANDRVLALFRQAEAIALQKTDALEKIQDLYKIYKTKERSFAYDNQKAPFVEQIIKEDGTLKKFAKMAEDPAFWPDDALDHAKAFVLANDLFLDDREFEDKLINDILDKLEVMPAGKRKNECMFILLDSKMRAAFPQTRERLFDIYVNDVAGKLGKDDRSETYQKRLAVYLKALPTKAEDDPYGRREYHSWHKGLLSESIAAADKYLLLTRLSDEIVSQEHTSQMMKEACHVNLNSKDMMKSYLYGIGVDYLTEEMDCDPELAKQYIAFFNSKGEKSDTEKVSAYIEAKMRERYGKDDDRYKTVVANTTPSRCKILYENFWSAPLQARAVMISRMLKSAIRSEDQEQDNSQEAWERVFGVVMDNVINPDDQSVEAKYAREVMHSYTKSRSDYERELILSGMMVASRNIGSDAGNVGKALKLFLENMGPAEIKLGQAIASHPNTPESIKKELKKLKSAANRPPRWTLYDWIKNENIPEDLWKDQYMGDILGSASYYTSVALGDGQVLRILRPEAREKANKGFRVIRSTVEDLQGKDEASDLNFADLTSSVQEMVIQAASMSEIETNHETGETQYGHAKRIYNGVTLETGGEVFNLKVMDWRVKGKNWIIMDRAKGVNYNKLPEDTSEQVAYKRKFAKGYVLFELKNILAGKMFDHDRHGDQLSIDPETNEVGIYDTGAMALKEPTLEEQAMLGEVLYDVTKDAMKGDDVVVAFSASIGTTIEAMHRRGSDTKYLVEVKKALLALGDFFEVLDANDVKDIFANIISSENLSEPVMGAVSDKLSLVERAKLKAFVGLGSLRRSEKVTIRKDGTEEYAPVEVENVNVAPDVPLKSAWLRTLFKDAAPGDDDDPSSDAGASEYVASEEYEVYMMGTP